MQKKSLVHKGLFADFTVYGRPLQNIRICHGGSLFFFTCHILRGDGNGEIGGQVVLNTVILHEYGRFR